MSGGGKLSPRPLEEYHERTRRRGVNALVYWPARVVIKNAVLLYFRVRRLGREHIPEGGVILAANHRSFLDPFVIGGCLRRPVYFVAKQELFSHRLVAWFLNCMGAFPLKRGESDRESMATALALLERGEAVVIFPEGTRINNGSLGRPKRGVGRLALQSGKPVVPIAVTGSERARDGWRIKPVKVHVRCGPPLAFPRVDDPSPFLAGEVTERIWPCVQLQWEWLGGLPPLRTAAVLGAGSTGKALARVLARASLEVQLGCRTASQVAALSRNRTGPAIEIRRFPRSSSPGWTSSCSPSPRRRCPRCWRRSVSGSATAPPSWSPRAASCPRWAAPPRLRRGARPCAGRRLARRAHPNEVRAGGAGRHRHRRHPSAPPAPRRARGGRPRCRGERPPARERALPPGGAPSCESRRLTGSRLHDA